MSKAVKPKIFKLREGIEDDTVLNQLMENVTFYTNKKDILDELNADQAEELDKALKEADSNEIISRDDFKKDMNEWRKR
jgi:hypothetical protein